MLAKFKKIDELLPIEAIAADCVMLNPEQITKALEKKGHVAEFDTKGFKIFVISNQVEGKRPKASFEIVISGFYKRGFLWIDIEHLESIEIKGGGKEFD